MFNCIKMELYKSIHNRYFGVSLFALDILVLIHIIKAVVPYYGMIYGEYPETVFNHWIGLQISSVANIYYMVVVGCATLPIGMAYIEEKRHGYFNQLLSRTNRIRIFVSKLIAYVATSFLVTTIPLLLDYMIASAFLPSIRPIAATFYYSVGGDSFLSGLFFRYPTLYLLIYIGIDGILVAAFSLLVIPAAKVINNKYAVVCCPMVVFIAMKIVFGFMGLNEYIPMCILYPSISDGITLYNVILEIVVVGAIGVIGMFYEVYNYET